MSEKYDILIIGGGPAGMTAGIYTARAGMKVVVVEKSQPGGQLWLSESIENYPGFSDGVSSAELSGSMEDQAKNFGVEFISAVVENVVKIADGFSAKISSGNNITSDAVIIAGGATMSTLGVTGEKEYTGRGVSYCAVCDGPLFRDKVLAVVGGGNTACEEAIYLTRFARKVYLVHRRPELRAVKNIRNEVENNSKIELLLEKQIKAISGDELVKSIKFEDGTDMSVDGVFIFVGLSPSTGCVEGVVDMEKGFIKTDKKFLASVDGVFAAGDCRYGSFRQVVTACGEGAAAGEEARKFVEKKKGTAYDW